MLMNLAKPSKGKLLVAKPSILNDTSFNRSIVLLTEHNNENSIGFIINKPSAYYLEDLVPNVICDFTVYEGGPVEQENLYFIHKIPDLLPNSIEVSDGIYWGGDFKELTKILNLGLVTQNDIKFFLGYSGWTKGQLNKELTEESWMITDNVVKYIFECKPQNLWKNFLLKVGGKYKIWANAPKNPSLN